MNKGSFILCSHLFLQTCTQCPYLAVRHLLGYYLMALISTVCHFDGKKCDPVDKSVLQMQIFISVLLLILYMSFPSISAPGIFLSCRC